MDYDIEADWKLVDGCNYRCSYCFLSPESLGSKLTGLPGADAWASAFEATGKTWLLHITGGEPSLHPDFAPLCERLAERHFLSFNSNFSRDAIGVMASRVPPGRISLIHAALHPDERTRKRSWAAFAKNLETVAAYGHRLIVSVVATPDVLARYDEIAAQPELMGFRPVPKMMRDTWQGKPYPASYTDEERESFRAAHRWAREGYSALIADPAERPTIWPLGDDEMLEETLVFHGNECEAGRRFVAIEEDGKTYRCGTDGYLGNLLDGTLVLSPRPITCATSYCPYFCRKHSHKPLFRHRASRNTPLVATANIALHR